LDFLGIDCEPTDDDCINKAFDDMFKDAGIDLPDCADGDDACW
jgi:hypothetical protein